MEQLKTNLALFSNKDFNAGRGPIVRGVWYLVNMLIFNSYLFPFYKPKAILLRLFGAQIQEGLIIKPKVNIKYPWRLFVGKHVWIGENVWIDNLDTVKIEDNCCISQGAMILSGNHNYKKQTFDLITKPIVLERGVWIGAQSVVTQGVTCGQHAVLAVASVASTDLLPYAIYKGNPAVKINERRIQ
jgi:putative colanic acid biosynthesis acetyltransferase WcaF